MYYQCENCTEEFYDQYDCDEHMADYGHWPECEVCPRTFRNRTACNQHMNSVGHWAPRYKCEICPKTYGSQNAANQHMNAVGHWKPRVPCETCNSMFHSQSAADAHMKARDHYKYYCKSCDRQFQNENNLRAHLNSKIHRGQNITCPFCKLGHTTASGLSHHLESGSCRSAPRLNRETIYRVIRERDPHGVITHKQIGWVEEQNAHYSASNSAWNGNGFECYLCHREFTKVSGLNQHLNSPAHKQRVYHCPNGGCSKPFAALAGLFNHLESESCSFMRFEKVQASIGVVLQGNRLISF
ncbi:hypothetical protein BDW59DRAFT_149071 [Aspergillus cavernicola]|uniref:C2H2-type domain-containing protein n=1 Tax=Aspergillus cavernicola TaxID=176166 RepID=A0ABR4I8A1_9EURO